MSAFNKSQWVGVIDHPSQAASTIAKILSNHKSFYNQAIPSLRAIVQDLVPDASICVEFGSAPAVVGDRYYSDSVTATVYVHLNKRVSYSLPVLANDLGWVLPTHAIVINSVEQGYLDFVKTSAPLILDALQRFEP